MSATTTTDLQTMLNNARGMVRSANPSQDDVNTLTGYIGELQQALAKLSEEKGRLVADSETVGRTAQAQTLQASGDKIMQQLAQAQDALAIANKNLMAEQTRLASHIDTQRRNLSRNNKAFSNYASVIEQKMEILATRDRMLQLSQERNVYKKKVIYVLFAIIIALIIVILSSYSFLSKRRAA